MNETQARMIAAEVQLANPSPEAAELVELLVQNATHFNDDGSFEILDRQGIPRVNLDGSDMTVTDLVAEIRKTKPALFSEPAQVTSASSTVPHDLSTLTGRMSATIAAQKVATKDRAFELAALGNPWSKSGWNLTRQGMISNFDPELAGSLKQRAEAGR